MLYLNYCKCHCHHYCNNFPLISSWVFKSTTTLSRKKKKKEHVYMENLTNTKAGKTGEKWFQQDSISVPI